MFILNNLLANPAACIYMYMHLRNVFLGSTFHKSQKDYSLIDAGFCNVMCPTAGLAGAILSGIVSDKCSKVTNIPNLLYPDC